VSIPSGVNKQIVISKETTWNVKPLANSGKYYRRVGLDLNLTRDSYESAEISSTAQTLDARNGSDKVDGKLSAEMSCGSYDLFWAALLRGAWTAGSTTTATTISFTTGTIVRSVGSWITDGFKVGDTVQITGSVVSSGANNKYVTITAVTALVLTADTTFVVEAAGPSITVVAKGKKLSTPLLPSGRTNDSFTIEQWYDNISVSRVASGVKVNSASIKIDPNAMATVEFGLMGASMASTGSAYFTTPAAASTTGVLTGSAGALYIGGTKIATVTSISAEIDGGMEAGTVIGTRTAADIFLGRITAKGSFSAYFVDDTIFQQFINETDTSLVFRLDGPTGQIFNLKFPRIKIMGAPVSDAEVGGLVQSIEFTALLNDGTDTTKEVSTVCLQDTSL